ncbi:LysE family translocator [Shimia thalassica]|uniref:LysE family translocator n=1 Tax=Shimia thalassica TaxID=1715693 RepID=UPI0026E46828|nr:LysE family translocator [Shimia thalassica]MDO6797268.1 LysE family translocator [Shimia thalassica]
MSLDIWVAFVAASTALLMLPGPTILLVLSYALSQGRKVAVATAAGVAVGDFIAMSASLMGLGAVVLASATAFTALKWVGALYLVWLGIRMFRSAGRTDTPELVETRDLPSRGVFGHAAAVTALNPKSIGFFIAFVPQFIDPTRAMLPQFAILIATFVGLAATNAMIFALAADKLRAQISRPQVIQGLTRLGGITLIGMGVLTATLRRAG